MSTPDPEARLRAEGLEPSPWSNGPGDRYGAHDHGYDKVIVVARGSIRFGLPATGKEIELATGDRLDLPAGTATMPSWDPPASVPGGPSARWVAVRPGPVTAPATGSRDAVRNRPSPSDVLASDPGRGRRCRAGG